MSERGAIQHDGGHDAPIDRPAAVRLQSVSKSFAGVQALDDLDAVAPQGSISVLLGPNGAGKTTAIRMITGAQAPDVGSVSTLGLDPTDDLAGEEVRSRCGVVSAKPALYDRLSGTDNLMYAAELYGLGRRGATQSRIVECAERFGIGHALGQLVGGYSTGMKTRLALARSILHQPDLLLLDEPTSGLDPESAHAVLSLIREATEDGTTVIMCTHLLNEAEGLADHIIVLEDGTDVLAGSPIGLIEQFWGRPQVRIRIEGSVGIDVLERHPAVHAVSWTDDALVELNDPTAVPDIVAALAEARARVSAVIPFEPTLEQLYFRIRAARLDRSETKYSGIDEATVNP